MIVVAFTGHRPDKLGGYAPSTFESPLQTKVFWALVQQLQDLKPRLALVGMAQGVDWIAAEACIAAKVPFVAAVPFVGQESRWPPRAQARYKAILQAAVRVVVVSGPNVDPIKALQLRNEWMVDRADRLIAVWDESRGGTYNCVKYARLMGVEVTHIDPRTLK